VDRGGVDYWRRYVLRAFFVEAMSDDERKLLSEVTIALGALAEMLADGVGIVDLEDFARTYRERMTDLKARITANTEAKP
jgi:hypothetical protein